MLLLLEYVHSYLSKPITRWSVTRCTKEVVDNLPHICMPRMKCTDLCVIFYQYRPSLVVFVESRAKVKLIYLVLSQTIRWRGRRRRQEEDENTGRRREDKKTNVAKIAKLSGPLSFRIVELVQAYP